MYPFGAACCRKPTAVAARQVGTAALLQPGRSKERQTSWVQQEDYLRCIIALVGISRLPDIKAFDGKDLAA